MAKFIFEMPDGMSALVEAFRVKRGHKATAQAVRELISTGLEVSGHLLGPITIPPTDPKPSPDEMIPAEKMHVDVPWAGNVKRGAYQKTGKR